MLKYYNAMVVFEEIPNEITLAINISNCPFRCKECHSKFLWDDVGTELTNNVIDNLLEENKGITCVCFMGGDREPEVIDGFGCYIHQKYGIKVGWYSGNDEISTRIQINNFDFIKVGHYDEKLGGLNKRTTNQILYQIEHFSHGFVLNDITNEFWN